MEQYEETAMESGLRRWSVAGIVVGMLLAVIGGADSLRSMRQAAESARWVAHSQAANAALEGTLAHIVDIEAGARGFAATGDKTFLGPVLAGGRSIHVDLDKLASLTADNVAQQQRLRQLQPQLKARLETAEDTIAERQRTGNVPASALFLLGKKRMDAVRGTIAEMQAEEAALLDQRIDSTEEARNRAATVTLVSTITGVGMLLLAGIVTRREFGRIAKMRGEIQALNKQLEHRVEERTAELQDSRLRLQDQTSMLKLVLDNIDEGIVAADEQGSFQLWNPAAERILGRGPAHLDPGQWSPHYQVYSTDGHTPFPSERLPLVRALHGEPCELELIIRRPDGEDVWIDINARPIRDENGVAKGGVATFRDVTQRKKSEEVLAENSRLLELAPVLVRDMDSRILQWNAWAEKLYGFTREEAVGKSSPDLLQTEFPEPVEHIEEKLLQTGSWEGELLHRRKDGTKLVVASVWVLHRDGLGRPVRILEASTDVTQKKAAEREIRKLNNELETRVQRRTAELEAANKELEAFTYSVSHDLRAPLRHISGFSQILKEEFGESIPPEGKQHLQRIQDGTRRMGMLVDDLLNLGRLGRQEVRLQVTGLNSIVHEVVDDLKRDCGERQVEWRIGELPFVDCDPGLVRQVFQNLMANALKFTRPRSPAIIEVGQCPGNGAPVVYVRDNGVGFSMKYANKLFGVFQRLHRAEDFEGTGVGLATIQRIIQKHGGRIWVEAELEKGATFYFTLANAEESEIAAKAASLGGKS